MRHPIRSTAAACVAAALGASIGTAALAGGFDTGPVDGSDVLVSGCNIRFDTADGSPRIHSNAAHRNSGCKSVGINADGALHVEQTVRGATTHPIIGAVAQVDAQLTAKGIAIGPSGGTDDTSYLVWDHRLDRQLDLNNRSDRMRLQGRINDVWLTWVHSESWGR